MLTPHYPTEQDTRALRAQKKKQRQYYDRKPTPCLKLPQEKLYGCSSQGKQHGPQEHVPESVVLGAIMYKFRRSRRQLLRTWKSPRDEAEITHQPAEPSMVHPPEVGQEGMPQSTRAQNTEGAEPYLQVESGQLETTTPEPPLH